MTLHVVADTQTVRASNNGRGYASNVIQTFTFLKYDWSRLDIIDVRRTFIT